MAGRFRYLDHRGEEVGLANTEALSFKIQTGHVDASTLLYDATTDNWAAAGTMPIYQFLLEEIEREKKQEAGSEDVARADTKTREDGAEREEARKRKAADAKAAKRKADAEQAAAEEASDQDAFVPLRDDEWEPLEADEASNEPQAPDEAGEAGDSLELEDDFRMDDPFGMQEPVDPAKPFAPDSLGSELDGYAGPGSFARAEDPVGEESSEDAGSEGAGSEGAGHVRAREREADPMPPEERRKGIRKPIPRPPVHRRPGFAKQAIFAVVLLAAGIAGGAAILRQVESDADEPAIFEFPEEGSGQLALLPDSIPLTQPLQSMVERASALALQDMVASLDSLQRDFRLQDSPPPAWLGGLYLSSASRFPEVLEYWERYEASLHVLREEGDEHFRRSLETRLVMAGAFGETLQLLRRRALADFDRRRPRREAAYEQMGELASASIQLHDLLVRREADIAHEPADGAVVSRDPILEAVPADSTLNDEVWSYLNRIVAALEASQGVQPVSTARMVESLFDRLLLGRER